MYLKQDNVINYESFQWNVGHSTLCNKVIFIASCIANVLANEIGWSDELERRRLFGSNPYSSRCIGFIDDILIKFRRPWNHSNYVEWFNGCKKMYCMNNTIVMSH